jgi:hypothetical protein
MRTPTLYCSFQARVERLQTEWLAIEDGLGLSAHGSTVEAASSRLSQAINILLDTLLETGGVEAVKSRLNRAGLIFALTEGEEQVTRRTLPLTLSVAKSLEPA